jgi:hypothetical protein
MARKTPRKNHLFQFLIGAVVIAIIGYFAYSLQQFYGENAEGGIMTCDANNQNCKLSVHVHADVPITICGSAYKLPLETGPLDEPHTHKERNKIHLHVTLPYDPVAGRVTDTTKMQLGEFMKVQGVRFTSTCIADKCNGDLCNGVPGKLTMTVNGNASTEYTDYVWSDHDVIQLTFG